MKIAPATTSILLVTALLAASAGNSVHAAQANAGDKVLYRYTNEHGVQVLDDKVPPRYVAGGYEVLTIGGRVLEVVPPQLTGAELEAKKRREAQQEADRELLKRYNSVADIESARSRKLAIVEQDIAIMRSNIASLGKQIEQEETSAARTQRNGGKVAPELMKRIDSLREEVGVLRERLARREQEEQQLNREFDRAATRYAEIAGN